MRAERNRMFVGFGVDSALIIRIGEREETTPRK